MIKTYLHFRLYFRLDRQEKIGTPLQLVPRTTGPEKKSKWPMSGVLKAGPSGRLKLLHSAFQNLNNSSTNISETKQNLEQTNKAFF